MNPNTNDQKLLQTLNHIKHWGFKFSAYDETGMPLVIAPNGQIVEINIAIRFVNEQLKKQKEAKNQSGGGSIEAMPVAENIDTRSPETSVERSAEVEKSPEKAQEEKKQAIAGPDLTVKPTSAPIVLAPPKKVKPYGDGFDPKSFDPGNLGSTQNFIAANIAKSSKSSSKWLAIQFRKFIEENKIKVK